MIDRWFCRQANDDFSGTYSPEQAVTDVSIENIDAKDRLSVIFPPWHGGGLIVDALARRLARNSAVLRYQFHDRILEPDIENVQMSFNHIAKKAASDLEWLTDTSRYERVHLIGLGLGNVALAKTTRLFDDFDSAALVTAATSLSDAMWEGARTQNLRQAFEEQGVNQKKLRIAWYDLAPLTHAKHFKDKDVQAVISRSDTIIPAHLQLEMADRLRWNQARVRQTVKPLGHVATLTSFCIKG